MTDPRENINCFGGPSIFKDSWLGLFTGTMLTHDYRKCDPKDAKSFFNLIKNKNFDGSKMGDDDAKHPAGIDTLLDITSFHRLIDRSTNLSHTPLGTGMYKKLFNEFVNPRNINLFLTRNFMNLTNELQKCIESFKARVIPLIIRLLFVMILNTHNTQPTLLEPFVEYLYWVRLHKNTSSGIERLDVATNVQAVYDTVMATVVAAGVVDHQNMITELNTVKTLRENAVQAALITYTTNTAPGAGAAAGVIHASAVAVATAVDELSAVHEAIALVRGTLVHTIPVRTQPVKKDLTDELKKLTYDNLLRFVADNEFTTFLHAFEISRNIWCVKTKVDMMNFYVSMLYNHSNLNDIYRFFTNLEAPTRTHITGILNDYFNDDQKCRDISATMMEFEANRMARTITTPFPADERQLAEFMVVDYATTLHWLHDVTANIGNIMGRIQQKPSDVKHNEPRNPGFYTGAFTTTPVELTDDIKSLIECVCKCWLSGNDTYRTFYKRFFQPLMFDINAANRIGFGYGDNRYWVPISEAKMSEICVEYENTKKLNVALRLNLHKASDGNLLWHTCIPDVEKGTYYYTDANNQKQYIELAKPESLRLLVFAMYQADMKVIESEMKNLGVVGDTSQVNSDYAKSLYNMDPMWRNVMGPDKNSYNKNDDNHIPNLRGGGKTLKIPIEGQYVHILMEYKDRCNVSKHPWEYFNDSAWIHGELKPKGKEIKIKQLEDIIKTGMVDENRRKWLWDKTKGQYYHRDDNGNNVYFDKLPKISKNCYETYLMDEQSYDEKKCKSIMKCIGTNNAKKLQHCFTLLGENSYDWFEAAALDIERYGRHNPAIIEKVLGTFAVSIDKSVQPIRAPCSYDKWIKNLRKNMRKLNVDNKVIDQIYANKPLQRYIKGIIRMCRDNPSILNKELVADNDHGEGKYQRDMNMKTYRKLRPSSNKNNLKNSILTALQSYHRDNSHNAVNLMVQGNGLYHNTAFVTPSTMTHLTSAVPVILGGGKQVGGAKPESGFHIIYNDIKQHLNRLGLKVHPTDEESIIDSIKRVDKLNDTLATLTECLMRLIKMGRLYGINLNSNKPINNIHLKDIQSVAGVEAYLRKHLLKIKAHMHKNIDSQYDIQHSLYSSVIPTLLGCDDETDNDDDDNNNDDASEPQFFGNNE
jgi:hypothetical protein